MTTDEKAQAWELAALYLRMTTPPANWTREIANHIYTVVAPSMRRRAAIIRRNARKGTRR